MERIRKNLEQRTLEGSLRVLNPLSKREQGKVYLDGIEYLDFSSNDYLGLSQHPSLINAVKETIDCWGVGICASRLLTGDSDLHQELERKVACFKGKEAALVYNSGYQANLGVISGLYSRRDVIFSDKLSHASIIDGIALSGAGSFRYKHNDLEHLEILLKSKRQDYDQALIVTETVFSMDGDLASLDKLVELKEKYNCSLLVDEAHATGIFGKTGAGLVELSSLSSKVDLILGTFSKALAGFGAYIACSKEVKEYLINYSRSFIYSTALPPAIIKANISSIDLVKKESFGGKELLENARYFREELKKQGWDVRGESQIVPIVLGSNLKTNSLSENLKNKGYWVLAVRPPTVPVNQARLRFSLSLYHKKEDLDLLLEIMRGQTPPNDPTKL